MRKESLTELEKQKLRSRFQAMSEEEMEYLLSLVPSSLCLSRIEQDLYALSKVKENLNVSYELLARYDMKNERLRKIEEKELEVPNFIKKEE